ncbi:MAG: aldo/keto reductase [Saprospiraceae bacterium]|nr:aldo/keto reductase [Lewinella sp.]
MNRLKAHASKLALGTVQFGLDYGISNEHGKVTTVEVGKILETAAKYGMDILDTASAYGSSEAALGTFDLSAFKVVSKFIIMQEKTTLRNELSRSLSALRLPRLYAYIAHRARDLLIHPNLYTELKELREEGLVGKIGYSIYLPNELEALLEKDMVPDLVQVPYNILDRRFERYFSKLKNLGVEVHTRSTFLQGLFFLSAGKLDPYFSSVEALLSDLAGQFPDQKERARFLISFCAENPYIDKIVLGVVSAKQLLQNLEPFDDQKAQYLKERTYKVDEGVLLPYNWPVA